MYKISSIDSFLLRQLYLVIKSAKLRRHFCHIFSRLAKIPPPSQFLRTKFQEIFSVKNSEEGLPNPAKNRKKIKELSLLQNLAEILGVQNGNSWDYSIEEESDRREVILQVIVAGQWTYVLECCTRYKMTRMIEENFLEEHPFLSRLSSIHSFLQIILTLNGWCGMELNQVDPPTSSDDLCFVFFLILILWISPGQIGLQLLSNVKCLSLEL